jgi:tetratricopeptide (TPR) repeat protein
MEFSYVHIILASIAVVFAILEVLIHFHKGELRFAQRFPFIRIAAKKRPSDKQVKKLPHKRGFKRAFIPISVVTLIFAVILVRILFFHEASAAIRRPIAVMLFKNHTGETKFDYLCEAIPNLLITNLEQSKHLSVMTWERMYDLLKSMGKQDVKVIDEQLGFELCNMDGINNIVLGSFTKAGETFVTDVKVLDVDSKRMRYSASTQGEGVASILKKQIDELSKKILHGVGLSERAVEETKLLIADVTTNSMDAYNYYLKGRDASDKHYYDDARQFLLKAIELDSTFAMAYCYLGMTYGYLNERNAREEAIKKAKKYSNKATERERLFIEGAYAYYIERNDEKDFRILQKYIKKYPKNKRAYEYLAYLYEKKKQFTQAIEAYNQALALDPEYGPVINGLAYLYIKMGNYDKAIEYFKKYAAISKDDADPYDSMAELYFWMGKFDESITFYKKALALKPNFGSSFQISYIYALQEDYPRALQWIDQFIKMASSLGLKELGYCWKSFYYWWLGNSAQALKELLEAENTCQEMGILQMKADLDWTRGWFYLDRKEFDLGRRAFEESFPAALKVYPNLASHVRFNNSIYLGITALYQGQLDSVRFRIDEMNALLPKTDNRSLFVFYRELLRAELLLAQDSIDQSVALAEKTVTPMFTALNVYIQEFLVPPLKDVLARAYAKKGELDKAIAEYEKLLVVDGQNKNRLLIPPLYHYRLAQLYEKKGLTAKAIMQYEKFIDIWKDTDYGKKELGDAKIRVRVLSLHA